MLISEKNGNNLKHASLCNTSQSCLAARFNFFPDTVYIRSYLRSMKWSCPPQNENPGSLESMAQVNIGIVLVSVLVRITKISLCELSITTFLQVSSPVRRVWLHSPVELCHVGRCELTWRVWRGSTMNATARALQVRNNSSLVSLIVAASGLSCSLHGRIQCRGFMRNLLHATRCNFLCNNCTGFPTWWKIFTAATFSHHDSFPSRYDYCNYCSALRATVARETTS